MKNLTLCLIFTVAFSAFAVAQKCQETADPITGEKKIQYVYKASFHSLDYTITDNVCTLKKTFYYAGSVQVKSPAGTEIIFKLENGEILKLKTATEVIPRIYGGNGGTESSFDQTFVLTKADLQKLASSPVVLIRIPLFTSEGFRDLDKKNPMVFVNKSHLKKGAACMLEHLP